MRASRRLLVAALVVLGASLGTSTSARASYDPPLLDELLIGSETVVYGRIVSLSKRHYRLRVERWIRPGSADPERRVPLRVGRFVDWECGQRERPYAIGERLLVFLAPHRHGFVSLGAGCEGEWLFDSEEEAQATVIAVAAYAERYVPVGADGWIPVWRGMLRDESPHLRRLATRALVDTAWFNPGCGDFLLDDLIDVLADGSPRAQRAILQYPRRLLSAVGGLRALAHIGPRLEEGSAPSLAAAAIALRPYEASHHRTFLRALADDTVPLPERRLAADEVQWMSPCGDVAVLAELRSEFANWIAAAEDPELLASVVSYVDEMLPSQGDADASATDRERVLEALERPVPDDELRAAIERRAWALSLDDVDPDGLLRYLSPANRMVAWDPRRVTTPRMWLANDACDTIRWMRAGMAAEKAGDAETALAAYELAKDWAEDEDFPALLAPLAPDELTRRISEVERRTR